MNMMREKLTRKDIIDNLITNLKQKDFVYALWEGGAASFNRVDEWSDIDLYLVVKDEKVEDAYKNMKHILKDISEIEVEFRLPEPVWHGHTQVFWRLEKTTPFLFLDTLFMKESSKDKFLQYKIHGKPLVHFDKIGIVKDDPIKVDSIIEKIKNRLEMLKMNFELFQVLTVKELNRGNDVEALSYYISYTFKPLVELLRIKYSPYHYNFFTSYVYYELPADIVKRLQKLYFVSDIEKLRELRDEAEDWFWDIARSINLDDLKIKLNKNNN
jgi:hypothetical protein